MTMPSFSLLGDIFNPESVIPATDKYIDSLIKIIADQSAGIRSLKDQIYLCRELLAEFEKKYQ